MNSTRIKALMKLIDRLGDLRGDLDTIRNEEKEYRDSMPEDQQESARYLRSEEAICSLELALEDLDDAVSFIEEAVV